MVLRNKFLLGAKLGGSADDLFASLLEDLLLSEESDLAEALAAAQPQRMEKNSAANLNLTYIRVHAGRAREALLLEKIGDWRMALASADSALALDGKTPARISTAAERWPGSDG